MPDYRAHLLNCPIGGEEFNLQHNVHNLTRFSVDDLNIELIQKPELIFANYFDLRERAIETTDLIIRDLPPDRLGDAERIALDTSWLLSFATSSQVVYSGYDYGESSERKDPFIGVLKYFRPAFKPSWSNFLRLFLQQCFQNYRSLQTSRKLNVAIDYYVLSQNLDAIELGLITTFVLMENIKHTFAQQQGYPFIKKYFRGMGATQQQPGTAKTFESLLIEMAAAVHMTPSFQSAISLRNEVIHSGISTLSTTDQWAIYESCQNILREYLLRLLGYRGSYFPFSEVPGMIQIQ